MINSLSQPLTLNVSTVFPESEITVLKISQTHTLERPFPIDPPRRPPPPPPREGGLITSSTSPDMYNVVYHCGMHFHSF